MKAKKILIAVLTATSLLCMTGCSSCDRAMTDMKSDFCGGLNRTVNIYNYLQNLYLYLKLLPI